MSQKIRKGDEVLKNDYFPYILTIIDILPKGQFYVQYRNGQEKVVERGYFKCVSNKHRLLKPDERVTAGDEWLHGRYWYPFSSPVSVGNRIIRRLR